MKSLDRFVAVNQQRPTAKAGENTRLPEREADPARTEHAAPPVFLIDFSQLRECWSLVQVIQRPAL
jgi:hypothetical protein